MCWLNSSCLLVKWAQSFLPGCRNWTHGIKDSSWHRQTDRHKDWGHQRGTNSTSQGAMLLPLVGSENQETCHVSVIGGYGSIPILSCREPGRKHESSRVCWTYVPRWGSRLSPRAGLQVLCAETGVQGWYWWWKIQKMRVNIWKTYKNLMKEFNVKKIGT